jgi:phage I-like protein
MKIGGMTKSQRRTSVAALAAALPASGQAAQLLPAGAFRSADGSGRPDDAAHWKIDAAIAARLIARVAARANPLVVDYEHQTLFCERNGQPAPAAGWFAGAALEWRDGAGLFARVDWTPAAAGRIADGEYRYISPVFEYDRRTGEVLDLRMAALTNNPGLHGMAAVALKALNDFPTPEDPEVNETLKKLLAAIGLADDAGEADALAAVAALKARADTADNLNTQIAALKAQAPDPAKFVAVETMQHLQTQVAALAARLNEGEVGDVVAAALAAGKLLPAQKGWATDLGKSDLAALKAYVEQTPAIAALTGMQSGGEGGDGRSHQPTGADLAVMKAMGLTAAVFATGKQEV